jgi:hypothetical protein
MAKNTGRSGRSVAPQTQPGGPWYDPYPAMARTAASPRPETRKLGGTPTAPRSGPDGPMAPSVKPAPISKQ